jgi:hypothetical protein
MRSADIDFLDGLRARLAQQSTRGDTNAPVYPVAGGESLQAAESTLGSKFPELLARIYTEVANGGFGPASGLLGLAGGFPDVDGCTAVDRYQRLRVQGWKERLLPAFDWGDGCWSCVDLSTPSGIIVTADEAGYTATRFDVRTWFAEWMKGTDLHGEIYELGEATIINPFTRKPMVVRRREKAKGTLIQGT